jgi:hypothetical protein
MTRGHNTHRAGIGRAAIIACLLGIAAVGPAASAGSFDGTYRGTETVTLTNNSSECLAIKQDYMAVTVTDNKFVRRWGVATLPVEIGPDGTFSASIVMSNRPLRQLQIKGKIIGGNMEADIGTDLCAGHMSLKK